MHELEDLTVRDAVCDGPGHSGAGDYPHPGVTFAREQKHAAGVIDPQGRLGISAASACDACCAAEGGKGTVQAVVSFGVGSYIAGRTKDASAASHRQEIEHRHYLTKTPFGL